MYVYINSESNLYTVGFYDPNRKWHSDSDHSTRAEAAARVAYLNGGEGENVTVAKLTKAQQRMRDIVIRMQHYLDTYDEQVNYTDYTDTIFIDDMLYGIGVAIDPIKYRMGGGFDAFKAVLRERVKDRMPAHVAPHCPHCDDMGGPHVLGGGPSINFPNDMSMAESHGDPRIDGTAQGKCEGGSNG